MKCQQCKTNDSSVSAMVGGVYYSNICRPCLSGLQGDNSFSSGFQSFDRRRQWEDYAQDTVQPYDASGKPNIEFLRLYPRQAEKTYSREILTELRRRL